MEHPFQFAEIQLSRLVEELHFAMIYSDHGLYSMQPCFVIEAPDGNRIVLDAALITKRYKDYPFWHASRQTFDELKTARLVAASATYLDEVVK